jgi:2-phosphoglycerate kinase
VKTKVFLIGGAPGAGKTTLGTALASKLGITSLSIDDLLTAAQAVTTPESHPGLHFMRGQPFQEYFTYNSVERLKADATLQHEAAWPIVKRVIRTHVSWGSAIVIDGWHLRPSAVSQLREENIWSGWIVPSASVLDERERKNKDWLKGSPDPERMLENFLARSFWYNTLIKEQAAELQMNILVQNGEKSVEALCQMVLDTAE